MVSTAVVDDFLPTGVAHRLHGMYAEETQWEQQDQVRERHYTHVFKTSTDCLPSPEEKYIARFGRARALERSAEFNAIYAVSIKPLIAETLGLELSRFDTRCYRLLPGDLYRTHIDDYAGDVGLIYYINKRWVWDWGGILHICRDQQAEDIVSVLPKFNRAVLLNHKVFRFPHFISSVEAFALEPRYTIVSFNR